MRNRVAWLAVGFALPIAACRTPAPGPVVVDPVRLTQVASEGDPERRASLRLCAEGLRADIAGRRVPARSQYERAMQIDPTNPWVYLVLARQEVALGDPARALEFVQQAGTLLRDEGVRSPRVEPHLDGLYGAALRAAGRPGEMHLERAAKAAPEVWGDGRLDADELL